MLRTGDYALLAAVLISLTLSVYLWFGGQREEGLFVGPIFLMGVIVFLLIVVFVVGTLREVRRIEAAADARLAARRGAGSGQA